jgi:hypothetical protein
MTSSDLEVVELVGHTYRSRCRPGAGAGSGSGTQVPEPMWDRGTGLSHLRLIPVVALLWPEPGGALPIRKTPRHLTCTFGSGAERTRTADFLLAKQVLYQLSYRPREMQKTRSKTPASRPRHTLATV